MGPEVFTIFFSLLKNCEARITEELCCQMLFTTSCVSNWIWAGAIRKLAHVLEHPSGAILYLHYRLGCIQHLFFTWINVLHSSGFAEDSSV